MGKLSGKVAVVTGSSRGIGRAIAEAFAREGGIVIVNSRSQPTAEQVAKEIGHGALGIGADLSTEAGGNKLFGDVRRHFDRVDILVNNAGMPMVRDSLELTIHDWHHTIALNLTAPFLCSQMAARTMLSGAGGNIINVSSISGISPLPQRLAYAVTKAGLIAMTKVLAAEWAPRVRVNSVAPGYVETDLLLGVQRGGKVNLREVEGRTPLRRLGSVDDVAKACLFLASDDSSFITGQTVVVDGGWTTVAWP